MKRILLFLMGCAVLLCSAQQVTVLERTQLLQGVEGPAYHPVLSADGSQLLFSSGEQSGLKLYSFDDNVVSRVSDEDGAGVDAFWGGDGKAYYVSQERRANNLIYRTGHCYDLATGQSSVVLEPQHGAVRPMPATRGAALRGATRYASSRQLGVAVTTEGSEVVLNVNGKERRFAPVESDAGYLWASLSPDQRRVAFFAAGTGIIVMNLDGHVLAQLGNYEMPCWLDDNYLVAQNATDDGHQFTSSQIILLKADGTFRYDLTAPTSMTMQPTCGGGKIVFTSIDGQLHLMRIQISEGPSVFKSAGALSAFRGQGTGALFAPKPEGSRKRALTSNGSQPHVYINPGHGGHDADDRNVVVPPFAQGDTMGFWESNSNLWKGFALQEMLKKKGYKTSISRIRNRTADDLNLSTIVALCNSSGADVFYSIHSNATGAGDNYRINFPLGLYRGYTGSPIVPGSDKLAQDLGVYLLANQSTVWSENNYRIAGDWTFYPDWNNQGLGVLRGNNAVSMLDEGSFHDYYPETYRLINHDYDWVEGFNFSLGADRYFGRLENYGDEFEGIITGNLRDDRLLRNATYVMFGDDKRQPINGATVRLLDSEGNELQTTTTDQIENGIYLFKYVSPGTYTVEVSHPEHFTQTKQVEVKANAPTYCNFDLKRVRDTPPEVLSYSPVWSEGDPAVSCVEPIVFQFNWDMDIEATEAALEIEPAVEGTFRWEDTNYRLVFTPTDAYQTNTLYTVTLHKSAQHGGGANMEQNFIFQFMTQSRSHINTLALWPRENCQVHYTAPYVEFRTDSLLASKDLFNLFHVYDKQGTELDWSKRAIKNNKRGDAYGFIRLPLLRDLVPGDEYTLKIERQVSDTAGIHLPAEMNLKFTAADMGVDKPNTILVYDGEDVSEVSVDGMFKTATVSTSTTCLFGSKSLQLKWDFAGQENPEVLLSMASDQVFSAGDTLCLHVWGDMSCNKLLAVFLPTSMDDEPALPGIDEFEVTTLDFHGWQYIQMVVPHGVGHFDGFHLVPTDPRMGVSGTLLIDDILYKHGHANSGIDQVTLENVKVGPVPAHDYIVASADSRIQGVELIDLGGKVVVRHAGNYVNVGDIPAGHYLLKVYVNGQVSTHKVAVAH